MKKILVLILCVVMSASIFSACGKKEIDLPIAELNEDITEPMGKFYITNKKPAAEGGLVSLGKDFAVLMIEGKEYTFNLSEEVIRKIGLFNKDKDNLKIKRGTIIKFMYEMQNEEYFATDIELITAN